MEKADVRLCRELSMYEPTHWQASMRHKICSDCTQVYRRQLKGVQAAKYGSWVPRSHWDPKAQICRGSQESACQQGDMRFGVHGIQVRKAMARSGQDGEFAYELGALGSWLGQCKTACSSHELLQPHRSSSQRKVVLKEQVHQIKLFFLNPSHALD